MALCDEVDAVGGALGEDNRVWVGGVEEGRGFLARALVERRGTLAQQVRGAMDVGIRVTVIVVGRLDHRQWFLAGVRAVQVDQRLAVHELRQNRKVGADLRDVEFSGYGAAGAHAVSATSRARVLKKLVSICSRSAGILSPSSTSPAKA